MRPVFISQTGVGATRWVNPSWHVAPFSLNIAVEVSGTATFNIETTNDDYFTPPVGTVNVQPTSVSSATGAVSLALTAPVLGWRINVTSGTGTVTAQAVQAGIRS